MADTREITMQVPEAVGSVADYLLIYHPIEGLDIWAWLRWGTIIVLALAVTFWHQRQNQAFHTYMREKKQRNPLSDRLSRLAYNRSFEVFSLFLLLIVAIGIYETRLNGKNQRITAVENDFASAQAQIATLEASLAEQAARQKQAAAAAPTGEMTESQQEELDQLKRDFEGLFINYYLLKKCNLAGAKEFHLMHSSLMYRLDALNAPAGERRRILDAAMGSFAELYAETPCDGAEIAPVQASIQSYLTRIEQDYPDR